jgi:transposase
LRRAGIKKIAGIKGISQDKAQSLLTRMQAGQPATPPVACHTIQATARQILHLQTQIEAQQTYLTGLFKEHPNVKLLESINGIGLASAVRLMIEIEDVFRFDSGKALCAYFGVHPTWKESGDGHWRTGMSKQGRAQVRGILYMCSLSAIRWNLSLKALYHRFRKKGMNHYQAMGVVMHKLLRIVYGVLKNQTPYDPQVDRDNQQRSKQAQQAHQQEMARKKSVQKTTRQRYMNQQAGDSTEDAPISRRAYKKRKQEASQPSLVEEYAGSPPAGTPKKQSVMNI